MVFPELLSPDLLDLTDKDSSEWNLSGDEAEGILTWGGHLCDLLDFLKWCTYFDDLLLLCVAGSLSESGEEPEEVETRVMRSHSTSRRRATETSQPDSTPKEQKKLKLEWQEIKEEEEEEKESGVCLKGQEVATKKGILKESLSRAKGEKKRKSEAKRVRFNLKRTDEPVSDSDDNNSMDYVQEWVAGMKHHNVAVTSRSDDLMFGSNKWDNMEDNEDSFGVVREEEMEEEQEWEDDMEEEEEEEEEEKEEKEEEEEEEEEDAVEEEEEGEEEVDELEQKEKNEGEIRSVSFPGEGVRYIPPHLKEGSDDQLRGRVSEMLRKKVQGLVNR